MLELARKARNMEAIFPIRKSSYENRYFPYVSSYRNYTGATSYPAGQTKRKPREPPRNHFGTVAGIYLFHQLSLEDFFRKTSVLSIKNTLIIRYEPQKELLSLFCCCRATLREGNSETSVVKSGEVLEVSWTLIKSFEIYWSLSKSAVSSLLKYLDN